MGIEYIDYIPFQGDATAKEVGMQDFASKAFIYLKLIWLNCFSAWTNFGKLLRPTILYGELWLLGITLDDIA